MYSRELKFPPEQIIKNGRPVFGSFKEPFEYIDIKNVKCPFGYVPLPSFITNLRIRATLSYVFTTGDYVGFLEVFDSKIFGFIELILWDKKSGKKYAYRQLLGPHSRIVPKSTKEGICLSVSSRRYVRISWSKKENKISVLFHVRGDSVRPGISAALTMNLSDKTKATLSSVLPAPVQTRCMASFQVTGAVTGSVTFQNASASSDASGGVALMDLRRAYYPLRLHAEILYGAGFVNGKQLSFRLGVSNLSATDENTYNDNVLFVDGTVSPLPPVKITRPNGLLNRWVIQDMESMVDLSFYPTSEVFRMLSLLVLHTDYHIMCGTFEGVLLTNNGEPLQLKNFFGIGKKIRLRY